MLACLVYLGLGRYYSFYYNVFYLLPNCFIIDSQRVHQLFQCCQTPFETLSVINFKLFILEVDILFINTVVSEMHKLWFETSIWRIAILGWSIFASCKSRKSFLIYINSKRVNACNGNIYSHIKLISVDQQWIGNVLTYNIVRVWTSLRNFTYFACNKYASSLRLSGWLKYPKFSLIIHHILLQVLEFVRKNIGFWEKCKMFEPMDFSKFCNCLKH